MPVPTPGLKYAKLGVFDWFSNDATPRQLSGGSYRGTNGFLVSPNIALPIGAVIREATAWADNDAATAFQMRLQSWGLDGNGNSPVASVSVPASTDPATALAMTIVGGTHTVLADRTYNADAWVLADTQVLYGVRIGYTAPSPFTPITPIRVYDSRQAAYPVNGRMTPNSSRVISVADARDGAGNVVTANAVPAGVSAIAFNVTIAGATGPNFLSVTPGDATGYTASTINFPGGDDRAVGGQVALDTSRQVKVFCGDQTGSTHVIIDVTGYYL